MGAPEPRYRVNDWVKVRVGAPPGHFRTPQYVQGRSGRVAARCGVFRNPESLAHGGDGLPKQPLYRVEFAQTALWGQYPGPGHDKLLVDLYQHWLEPVDGQEVSQEGA